MEIRKVSLLRKSTSYHLGLGITCQIVDDITIVENNVRVVQETYISFRTFTKKESYGQYPFPSANIGCSLGVEQDCQCDEALAHWQKVHTLP